MGHKTENLTVQTPDDVRWEKSVIFTVTTIRIKGKENAHNRCVGYYTDKFQAFETLDFNYGSLIESGYYQYAVVEELPSGLYPDTLPDENGRTRRWWWEAVRTTADKEEHWVRLDEEPAVLTPNPEVDGFAGWTTYCEIG